MDETAPTFNLSVETKIISELLGRSGHTRNSRSPTFDDERAVVVLKTTDFSSLDDFKQAYLAYQQPVLCLTTPEEVSEVVGWLRDSDDIALITDSQALTDWRCIRISKLDAERLDPLTHVYRRSQLIESLGSACRGASPRQPMSLILLDIDHLKVLNDQLGIQMGDEILADLGQLIRAVCRETMVARTRGGEFGVEVHGEESIAQQIAHSIHRTVTQYQWCDQREITASLGVASVYESCEPSMLLARADEALWAAKANGRNRVVCHSEIAQISNRHDDELDVISMENKARVLSERVANFVTQRSKRIMESLRKEANTDGLTKLFNRRYFDKQLADDFETAKRSGNDLCVALVDLDHFGDINKKHGWPTGDKILQEVAENILRNTRGSDWVGRYGGEEFCIVMPGTNLDSAAIACERIRSSIAAMPLESTSGEPFRVTLSIGVVELEHQNDQDVAELVERVSQLTLHAKMSGRNQVKSAAP